MEVLKELDSSKVTTGSGSYMLRNFVKGDLYPYTAAPSFHIECTGDDDEDILWELSEEMLDWETLKEGHFYIKADPRYPVYMFVQKLIEQKIIAVLGQALPAPVYNYDIKIAKILI